MSEIFICYRHEDEPQLSDEIYNHLTRVGFDVFRDHKPLDTCAGENISEHITSILKQTKIMLVIIGPKWLNLTDSQGKRKLDDQKDPVRFEIKSALKRNIRIIPVLLNQTPMPPSQHLPSDIEKFSKQIALRIRNSIDYEKNLSRIEKEDLDKLEKRIKKILKFKWIPFFLCLLFVGLLLLLMSNWLLSYQTDDKRKEQLLRTPPVEQLSTKTKHNKFDKSQQEEKKKQNIEEKKKIRKIQMKRPHFKNANQKSFRIHPVLRSGSERMHRNAL